MPDDVFSIRRRKDREGDDLVEELKARRQATLEEHRERAKRLISLTAGVYFDPITREILRKVGSQFIYLRHDRRRTKRGQVSMRDNVALKAVKGGLYWDPKEQAVYQFRGGNYVLHSKNRRKLKGKSPTGAERRKG